MTCNLQTETLFNHELYDFVLGWGGFESKVERAIRDLPCKKGLCIGGNAFPPIHTDDYDVLFFETEWYRPQLTEHRNAVKAFGVNTQIYYPNPVDKLFNIITVGAFANWKRHFMLRGRSGKRLAVGQIQKGNIEESMNIALHLVKDGVIVSDMVEPEYLAKLYNASYLCYIPSDINGGGERAILEARACGISVECAGDNPKLKELCVCPVPTEHDYATKLKEGILSCL